MPDFYVTFRFPGIGSRGLEKFVECCGGRTTLQSWLLLLYKVPHEPSSRRVHVWRKLKSFGAVLLHDSVWVLPMTAHSLKQFQLLAIEISALGGDSFIWEARLAVNEQDEMLIRSLLPQLQRTEEEVLKTCEP